MNLGIAGTSVERIVLDYGITLITDDGAEIRIETRFTSSSPEGATVVIDPAQPSESMSVVVSVLHAMVTDATAADDTGALMLEFAQGERITVAPSDEYEAWSFVRQDGMRAIARPGGGLSIWGTDR